MNNIIIWKYGFFFRRVGDNCILKSVRNQNKNKNKRVSVIDENVDMKQPKLDEN